MKSTRFQLSVLVLLHLLVLGYPQMMKTFHVHQHHSVSSIPQNDPILTTQEEGCPICHFEFISFIQLLPYCFKVSLPTVEIKAFTFPRVTYPSLLFHFSLRAPPLAELQPLS